MTGRSKGISVLGSESGSRKRYPGFISSGSIELTLSFMRDVTGARLSVQTGK